MATVAERRLLAQEYATVADLRNAFLGLTNRIPVAIYTRWNDRIVRNGWHLNERTGARQYLRRYGGNIGVLKVTHLARCAEEMDCPDFALEMWHAAFGLLHPQHARRTANTQRRRVRRMRNQNAAPAAVREADVRRAVLNGIADRAEQLQEDIAAINAPPVPTAEEFYNDLMEDQEFT